MDSGARIRQTRLRAGLTQTELSRRSGVPQPSISAIERGRVEPRAETVDRLLQVMRERPSLVLERARAEVLAAAKRHKMRDVRVFGSAVYGLDTLTSDVDLLVRPEPGATLFDLTAFQLEAEELLGFTVDVVSDRSRGHAMSRIRREALTL